MSERKSVDAPKITRRKEKRNIKRNERKKKTRGRGTYCCGVTFTGMSMKQRCLSMPAHNCMPTIPKMKKTKKHSRRTFPSMGSVSSRSITRILIPGGEKGTVIGREDGFSFNRLSWKERGNAWGTKMLYLKYFDIWMCFFSIFLGFK